MSIQPILPQLTNWFGQYTASFRMPTAEAQRMIQLKIDHTQRVRQAIVNIGRQIGLSPDSLARAEVAALFHDVGRFEQYQQYGTFRDADSMDHAQLGVQLLQHYQVLQKLHPADRERIYKAIAWHNRLALPQPVPDAALLQLARLLRDADKVDIFKVVTESYQQPGPNRTVALGLSDKRQLSPKVVQAFLQGKMVAMHALRTIDDFKVLQLAWIHDLQFSPSRQWVIKKGYLPAIADTLPEGPEKSDIQEYLTEYLAKHQATTQKS